MQEAMARARRAAQHASAPQALRHSLYAIPWFLFLGDAPARLRTPLGRRRNAGRASDALSGPVQQQGDLFAATE